MTYIIKSNPSTCTTCTDLLNEPKVSITDT